MSNTPDSTTHLNQAMIYQIRIEGQLRTSMDRLV